MRSSTASSGCGPRRSRPRRRGEYRGGARPFGFEADGVTIRESEAKEIRDATRRLLAGEKSGSIIADWNRRGVPTPRGAAQWRRQSLSAVVVRARNAGKIEKIEKGRRYGEIVGPAVWPAIVPEHELLAVRALLADPTRKAQDDYRGERRHLGSGLFLCGICRDGTPVKLGGGESRKRKRDDVYAGSYVCRKFVHCTRALHPIDLYVDEVMREILKRPETRLRIYDVPETDLAALQAEATSIEEEIAGLRVDLGRREITRQDFKVAKAGMEEDLAKVTAKLSSAAARSPLAGIADADDVDQAWDDATLGRKRAVIEVLATVTLLPGQRGRLPGGRTSIRTRW
jgi:site-specific DNA recombinase